MGGFDLDLATRWVGVVLHAAVVLSADCGGARDTNDRGAVAQAALVHLACQLVPQGEVVFVGRLQVAPERPLDLPRRLFDSIKGTLATAGFADVRPRSCARLDADAVRLVDGLDERRGTLLSVDDLSWDGPTAQQVRVRIALYRSSRPRLFELILREGERGWNVESFSEDLQFAVALDALLHLARQHLDPWDRGEVYVGLGRDLADCEDPEAYTYEVIRTELESHGLAVRPASFLDPTEGSVRTVAAEKGPLLLADRRSITFMEGDRLAHIRTAVYRAGGSLVMDYAFARMGTEGRWEAVATREPARRFGVLANLAIILAALVAGHSWLRKPPSTNRRNFVALRRRAYQLWYAAWVAWAVAWVLIAFATGLDTPLALRIAVLFVDNANTLALILVYFVLTRGIEFGWSRVVKHGLIVFSGVSLLYVVIYAVFWRHPEFAFELHRTWSLCFSVLSFVIIGWAFGLRFNTAEVAIVSVTYGFLQPIVYASEIAALADEKLLTIMVELRPVITMVLAFMKALWAVLVMVTLWGCPLATDGNLVHPAGSAQDRPPRRRGARNKAPTRVVSPWKRLSAAFTPALRTYAAALLAVYVVLVVLLASLYVEQLGGLSIALTITVSFMAILQYLVGFWRFLGRSDRAKG